MPKMVKRKDLTLWKNKFYAHRGLHNNAMNIPENSLTAFLSAVENNYGIELDVHITKDKIPVVFHDYSLLRMCGVNKDIEDLTFEELNKLTLHKTKERIPTLESVLDLVKGKVPLIVEFKSNGQNISVCKYAQPFLEKYQGTYCIESFNPLVLLWYKRNYPSIIRGQLSSKLLEDNKEGNKRLNFLLENMLFNFITQPDFIAFSHEYPQMLSFKICRNLFKTPTFAWTVRSNEELIEARKYFDSFIFEDFKP